MPTKEQLAVPAANAEQLDPSPDLTESEIGDDEIVGDPTTRGVTRGKDLKKYREDHKEADKKSAAASQKVLAKEEPNMDLAVGGEAMPKEVAKKADEQEKLTDEKAKDLQRKTEKGQKAAAKESQ